MCLPKRKNSAFGGSGTSPGITRKQMPDALAATERSRLPAHRELAIAAIAERMGDTTTNPDSDYAVRLTRVLFM